MSLAEQFLKTAKDMLMMSENIKRLDARVDRMAGDMNGLDRRVMRIELMVESSKEASKTRRRTELP